jgi:hypothetical protein
LPWSHVPITFTAADIRLQHYPHNDPLVIRANIGKNTKYYFGNDVGRILVDNGSSADILTWQCFTGMGFNSGKSRGYAGYAPAYPAIPATSTICIHI